MSSVPNRIPKEVHRFFEVPGGHSLIVRGEAGTGKTTLALQTIEELRSVEKCFYHSTRVSDRSLMTQFTWLEELMRTERSDSRSLAEKRAPGRHGLSDLKGIADGMSSLSPGRQARHHRGEGAGRTGGAVPEDREGAALEVAGGH